MRSASAFLGCALLAHGAAYLEPNRGQADIQAAFLARTSAGSVAVGSSSMQFVRRDGFSGAIVFEGASRHARAVPEQPLPSVSHYVRDRDPTHWVWDVPHYRVVRYHEVYPGIDLIYRVSRDDLEFDFILAPGADASRIGMRIPSDARVDTPGVLALNNMLLHAPVAWQTVRGRRVMIPVRFKLDRRHRAWFELGDYDPRQSLTIDPVVQFATFLGGSNDDIGMRVLSGPDRAIYTAGNTMSADFPASLSADDPLNRPDILLQQTAYIARLKPDASAFDWSLFIGGSARQSVFGLKQDPFGNLYLLGGTTSPNFPVTPGAWRTSIDPSMSDMFLVKFDALTGHIKMSTFLGVALYSNRIDEAARLAVDMAGGIYIAGPLLYSSNFAATPGTFGGKTPSGAFVLRLNPAINAAVYASYWPLGSISAMDVDAGGNLLVGGTAFGSPQSGSPPFPAVNPLPGVNQTPTFPGQAYLARLNAGGTAVSFATLLHGDGRESGISDIEIASDGSAYVVGWTAGSKFPQVNPLILDPPSQPTDVLVDSPFLARLAGDGTRLLQSTLFSGSPYTPPQGQVLSTNLRVAMQPNGLPCLAGLSMPATQQTAGGLIGTAASDVGYNYYWSLSCVDADGMRLSLKTGLPRTGASGYTDVATTPDGALLFTGSAANTFATTPGVVQPGFGGAPLVRDYYSNNAIPYGDGFLLRIGLDNPAPDIQRILPDFPVLDTSFSGTCSEGLSGSGFAYGAGVTLNGQAATYSFSDSTHATLSFDCGLLQPGDNHIVMTLPPPGGGISDKVVTAINAAPSTISVSPSSVAQGAAETKLVIRAMNLTAASALYWNGSPRAASFVLDGARTRTGHFELLLEPPELAQPAAVQVTVSNPGPGGGFSPVAIFAVQPASGSGVPTLSAPPTFIFGGIAPLGPLLPFSGSGFNSNTRAFWDGAEAPVSLINAGRINIQPPAADLSHLGTHNLYVTNDAFRSATVHVLIGRALSVITSAYDPVLKRLYALTTSQTGRPADLQVLDITTATLLSTVPGLIAGFDSVTAALSADGSYLYVSAYTRPRATILRYNTVMGAVDLQWDIPSTNGINAILTPPDSAETVIVSTVAGQILIYDRDRPRSVDSASVGFPTNYYSEGYPIVFAGASRIYGTVGSTAGSTPCWFWLDYDAFGISGGQRPCSVEPPETLHDSGVTYLSDGTRLYAFSLPSPLAALYLYAPSLAIDLTRRHAWQFSVTSFSATQFVDYNMDSQQLLPMAQPTAVSFLGGVKLYPAGDGGVLLVLPSYTFLIR